MMVCLLLFCALVTASPGGFDWYLQNYAKEDITIETTVLQTTKILRNKFDYKDAFLSKVLVNPNEVEIPLINAYINSLSLTEYSDKCQLYCCGKLSDIANGQSFVFLLKTRAMPATILFLVNITGNKVGSAAVLSEGYYEDSVNWEYIYTVKEGNRYTMYGESMVCCDVLVGEPIKVSVWRWMKSALYEYKSKLLYRFRHYNHNEKMIEYEVSPDGTIDIIRKY